MYVSTYISQISVYGPYMEQNLTTKFEHCKKFWTIFWSSLMEFGLIRVAQKDSMYLSCILVIFSIARFWLNILYAKVIVRNTREGVFGGNIFRKTEIPLIFVETIIEEDIPETSCAKIVLLILFVWLRSHCFLRFLIHWGKCTASAALRTWSGGQFGAGLLRLYRWPYQLGAFRKVLEGVLTHLPPWPWTSPGLAALWMLIDSPALCIRSMISLHLGQINVLDSVESFTQTWPCKVNLCFSWETHILML